MRVITYNRQSEHNRKSIADQTAANRAVVEANGWKLVAEFSDGTSASRFAERARDDWPRVVTAIEAGHVDVLVLWESSRGSRDLQEWAGLLALCRRTRVMIHITGDHRTYDPSEARDWRSLAEDGVDSAYESEKTSKRIRRAQPPAAAAGRPSHGKCPYGYRRTYDPRSGKLEGQEPEPAQARVVDRIFKAVAASQPITALVVDLNREGEPGPVGLGWNKTRVRAIVRNVAYLGKRRYNGQVFDGTWPPVVDELTFYAANRILAGRAGTRPGAQRNLLSYLAVCDVCGTKLGCTGGGYFCEANGCVRIRQADTDELVTAAILAGLRQPAIYAALRHAGDDADQDVLAARLEVERLRVRLDEFRASAVAGETTPATLAVVERELTHQISQAQRRAEVSHTHPALRAVLEPGEDITRRWQALTLPAQREVIRALATIRVGRASVRGSRRFEPGRLDNSRWVGHELTWGEMRTAGGVAAGA